jgi:hypothetical protein
MAVAAAQQHPAELKSIRSIASFGTAAQRPTLFKHSVGHKTGAAELTC